jgi:hypothetical protein
VYTAALTCVGALLANTARQAGALAADEPAGTRNASSGGSKKSVFGLPALAATESDKVR